MISSRRTVYGWVELIIAHGSTEINIDVKSNELKGFREELMAVLIDVDDEIKEAEYKAEHVTVGLRRNIGADLKPVKGGE